jgi:hypothetical protein
MINIIEKKFGKIAKNIVSFKTPRTSNFNNISPKEDGDMICEGEQSVYRSGVGSLLYLVKYSHLDIANTVRELATGMGGATPAAFRELQCVIKFFLERRKYGLNIELKKQELIFFFGRAIKIIATVPQDI